jgi:peroxiredoxin
LSNNSQKGILLMAQNSPMTRPFWYKFFLVILALLLFSCSSEKSNRITTGDTIPSFTGTDINGQTISLDAYKGHPVVLRFFLVDCKFCTADTPAFNSIYEKYKSQGLKIVYVNNDAPGIADVRNFAEKLAIPFPVIYNKEGDIAAQYNIKAQPLTLLLDSEHRLLSALLGGVSETELEHIMAPHLTASQK